MKTRIVLVLGMVLVLAAAVSAQKNAKLTVYTGYSMTAFENQGSAAGAIPLGVSVGVQVAPAIVAGGEFFYPLGGYKFESTEYNIKVSSTFNQMMVGAFGKYLLGSGSTKLFLKGGIGYYFGDVKAEATGFPTVTEKVKAALGINAGAGIQMDNGLSLGATFNIVKRESTGMNTWAVLVGYSILK
jgi:hypothetical protein